MRAQQQCINHIRCLSDLATRPLVTQASLFQVEWMFGLVFINGFDCIVVTFSMKSVKEQRICIKFCFKVGLTAVESHNMLHEVYSDDALSQTMT
jgi:hypothetical protein